MEFDLQNSLPIWKQLASQLKERIVTGGYAPGAKFPSVRDLASEAGVNPNTMQRALSQLEADGLLLTNRTSGRTVTEDCSVLDATREALACERANTFLKDMDALGFSRDDAVALLQKGLKNDN